jgi:oligopeptide/dipeptide ABC transporter ATP-binding protein
MDATLETTPLLQVQGLSAEYGTLQGAVRVLDDVSLTVRHNQIVGVVGESGSGKSTAVRSVIRLLQPPGRVVEGSVQLEGLELTGLSGRELRRVRGERIGFVAQSPFGALNPVLRLEKQFYNVIKAHRPTSKAAARERARHLLTCTGIPDPDRTLDGYAHQLSGGMAQRVALALAMALDPVLLIADEPTTALDLTVQRQVLDLMQGLIRESRRSMLLVTHDLSVVATYCDQVVVMYTGRVAEAGDVATVFRSPQHPYTRALLDAVTEDVTAGSVEPVGSRIGAEFSAAGCAYAPRCPRATVVCAVERPPLVPHDGGQIACHNLLPVEVVSHADARRA